MKKDNRIYLLVGDLGWNLFDQIKKEFSINQRNNKIRFINCGVAEQSMVGIATGLASAGKIPFVYSITPFLVYRAYEFIRNDVGKDQANVKLIGSGRNKDYDKQGFSHWCTDDKKIMTKFHIKIFYPQGKEEIPLMLKLMIKTSKPCYLNLAR